MSFFDDAVQKTLLEEGLLSNDKFDRGGLTKYGICQKSYPALDIENLTKDEAIKIYKRDFWDIVNLETIPFKEIAIHVFDIGVNNGTNGVKSTGVKLLQRAINSFIIDPQVPVLVVDGVLGAKTLALLKRFKEIKKLNNAIIDFRIKLYEEIIFKNPTQIVFRKNWLTRAEKFRI